MREGLVQVDVGADPAGKGPGLLAQQGSVRGEQRLQVPEKKGARFECGCHISERHSITSNHALSSVLPLNTLALIHAPATEQRGVWLNLQKVLEGGEQTDLPGGESGLVDPGKHVGDLNLVGLRGQRFLLVARL